MKDKSKRAIVDTIIILTILIIERFSTEISMSLFIDIYDIYVYN